MDYKTILNEINKEIIPFRSQGKIATYIPELGNVNPEKFAVHLLCTDGNDYAIGDSEEKFSIQSISKVLSLAQAMSITGEKIWQRVDIEPSGNPFNSLVQLEYEKGIPRNPLINSGALVIADILVTHLKNPQNEFLNFVRFITGNDSIHYNLGVAHSEKQCGFRNAALANLLKSFGNIQNEVEKVLDFYFLQCSIEMSCKELAQAFLIFANHGMILNRNKEILTIRQIKRINSLMLTCGFYDEAGEFSFKVGLAGKSGVGGGIVAIHPEKYSVAVWGPKLNEKGNSVMGMKALELLTTKTGMSIF
ncbi:MAG: glutaminase [Bacteroidetes bacterium]|nr:glutaminase [Bacteroidota bacterium]